MRVMCRCALTGSEKQTGYRGAPADVLSALAPLFVVVVLPARN